MARSAVRIAWDNANRERIRTQAKARYYADPEKSREQRRDRQARYRERHPDRVQRINRANYVANREQRLTGALAYQAANLGTTIKANRQNRRARLKAAEGKITKATVENLRSVQSDICVYCPAELAGGGHLDHRTPLSRGGSNHPENLQMLCEPCNLRKYNRTHDEFVAVLRSEGNPLWL